MTTELQAFRSVDFDWTRQLKSVWRDPPYHVTSLHEQQLDNLLDYFTQKTRDPDPDNEPLGRVVVGPAGYGKTHLVGELRRRVWDMKGWFVLLDFIGIKDFWSSVALGFLNSLQVRMPDGQTQYDLLVKRLGDELKLQKELTVALASTKDPRRELPRKLADVFVKGLSREHLLETRKHRDVVTALVLLISEELDCHSVAHAWLQGMSLEPERAREHGFVEENSPVKVVEGLSWLLSLTGPTLVAVDQIDAIVSASNALDRAKSGPSNSAEQLEAFSIVEALSEGLMELHEKKRRAVTMVACLEATWKVLEDRSTVAVTARYHSPVVLKELKTADVARAIVSARLSRAYGACSFVPPYPTWPFTVAAFDEAAGSSPRSLLRMCENHRQKCVIDKAVAVCSSFHADQGLKSPRQPEIVDGISVRFRSAKDAADIAGLMSENGEGALCELLDGTLRLLEQHFDLPDDIDVEVQRDPDQKRPSLHGRMSFTFRSEGDKEQHYCFRIIGHTNPIAFQSRLKAAMTASGIDTSLKFRHLFVLRRDEPPGGATTKKMVAQFQSCGGKFAALTDDDLRVFEALRQTAKQGFPGFEAWLRDNRPLFETAFFKTVGLAPPPFAAARGSTSATATIELSAKSDTGSSAPGARAANEPPDTSRVQDAAASPRSAPRQNGAQSIPLGNAYAKGRLGDALALPANLLPRHVAIIAGPGSGKTVLLRRIVEEAALLDIPAIVLDINNDLSRLGLPWPTLPEGFTQADATKSDAYRAASNVVIWTPGAVSGRPLSLKLLPDFAGIGAKRDPQTDDERNQAVEMARATLAPYVGARGAKGNLKQGVLAETLRYFAIQGGGSLDDLTDLLSELPEGISQIGDAAKLAGEMADQIRAAVATNPLLQPTGTSVDPRQLFYGPEGKTRISVINFSGLASDEARQAFVNQLQMTLFTWIKQNPSKTGRLYVIDEAQNFVPSVVKTPCKASAQSLVAQARKYGLGMIFATQLPKGIENGIVSNCTTHLYGRMGSPATISAVHEIMSARGGAVDDIGRLTRGEFYFSTDGSPRPVKVRTPLCLSWHPQNPPTGDEVMILAREKGG